MNILDLRKLGWVQLSFYDQRGAMPGWMRDALAYVQARGVLR